MNSEIIITALNIDKDDDDFTKFRIYLNNGSASASFEFYNYVDCFNEFGNELESFPKSVNQTVIFQVGENSEKWAYYMKLKVYCYEPSGNSTIHIELDNHDSAPNLIKSEFHIKTIPSALNKFGQALKSWNPKENSQIILKIE